MSLEYVLPNRNILEINDDVLITLARIQVRCTEQRLLQAEKSGDTGVREPELYVFPISCIKKVRDSIMNGGK